MTKTIYTKIALTIFSLLLALFSACDFDQIEENYSDYYDADKNGLFKKGWIPSEIVFNSMTDIYQRTNLDLNSCVFNYFLSNKDIEDLKDKVEPTSIRFKKSHRVKTSSDWINSVNELRHYYINSANESDTVFLAIDEKNNKIYGWR